MKPSAFISSFLLMCGVFFCSTARAQSTIAFADGAGEVTLPSYLVQIEDSDASLVAISKPEGNVKLYFDLHKLDAVTKIERPAELLVREQAQKKDKKLREHMGKVLFLDPSPVVQVDGQAVVNLHWQIGFDKTLVIMSARIPQAARDAPDVKRLLSGDLERIIASLKRVGG